MQAASRDILIHYHIFKNAGTSIDGCLRSSFGERWATLEGVRRTWTSVRTSDLRVFIELHPTLRAMSSHSARWPEPSDDIHAHPIVFLRHPIDRVASAFGQNRRQPEATGITRTLREFVEVRLRPDVWPGIRSYQTLYLSDEDRLSDQPGSFPEQIRHEHFAAAVRRLHKLRLLGLVENFEESMVRIVRIAGTTFPEMTFTPRRDNATPGRAPSLDQRLSDIADALGPVLYRRLVKANEADLELYSLACSTFARRTVAAQ
jgi:hypothetical protein